MVNFSRWRLTALALGTLAVFPAVAPAAVITATGTGSRNGSGTFNVPVAQFNSSLGTLNSITIVGNVFAGGSHGLENLDATSNTIVITHTSTVSLGLPNPPAGAFIGATTLNISSPPPGGTIAFPAFDGVDDKGGTSGQTFSGLSATGSNQTTTLTSAAALAAFTGGGTVNFLGNAANVSSADASGNVSTSFLTTAGANVQVTYDYTPRTTAVVPAPPSAILVGVGLMTAFGSSRLRRRRAALAV